jgi:hypothetical protein
MLRKLCLTLALAVPLTVASAPAQAQRGLQAEYAATPSGPVTLGNITASDELLAEDDVVGPRDIERLSNRIRRDFERELSAAGHWADSGAGAVLNVVILDATPNRPTSAQIRANPSLSIRSFGIGGAELEATLVSASGETVAHYRYEWSSPHIGNSARAGVWTDAERAIGFFADRVAGSLQAASAGS